MDRAAYATRELPRSWAGSVYKMVMNLTGPIAG